MAENYVLLETIELTQAAASVVFDNIPQSGYTDLKVVMSVRGSKTGTGQGLFMAINGVTTNRTWRWLYGTGSAAGSSSGSDSMIGNMNAAGATANTFSNIEVYIPNYTSSTNKSISVDGVDENNATSAFSEMTAVLWASTAAINSLTFTPEANDFVANSTFSLYGIAAVGTTPVIAPKATGGNIVANDGTYWYHAFLNSGNFVPQTALTCDVLTIAGGGSGGTCPRGNFESGGGGGAGGLLAFTSQTLTSQNYTVTVGAGGAGASQNRGSSGSNSQFGSLTAAVGGGAGGGRNSAALSGGSGGGGEAWDKITAAAGTSGQGNAGGDGRAGYGSSGPQGPGGGGGKGAAGGTSGGANNWTGGAGGIGDNTYSSWATATSTGVSGYYAAGGGGGSASGGGDGGAGGTGGGGNGASWAANTNGTSGTSNTGSGGGGTNGNTGGSGGSGIVIIRYAMV